MSAERQIRQRGVGWGIALLVGGLALVSPASLRAQQVLSDVVGDAVVRRTDHGNNGALTTPPQRLPDVSEIRLGRFAPTCPSNNRFQGAFSQAGAFLRLDVVFEGLINPPGTLGWDKENPLYAPFTFGPHPVFGWIEVDLDADMTTGGELDHPQYRFLGTTGRFGGAPISPYAMRAAMTNSDFDGNLYTMPFVEGSGEEFHLSFNGEYIETVNVVTEAPGGNPSVFEAGEVWIVNGKFWHRAHGFEEFSFLCSSGNGSYKPYAPLRFEHDKVTDRTTVSLVFALTQAGAASLGPPGTPINPLNGCDDDQCSIEEALFDLRISAQNASPADRMLPEFQLIAGWEYNNIYQHLEPQAWTVDLAVGTAYATPEPDESRFVWTDTAPSVRVGDFDGDGLANETDVAMLLTHISLHDGDPQHDSDGNSNNDELQVPEFSYSFCTFDTNYDGFVRATDAILMGDMDISLTVTVDDVDDFVQALLEPSAYVAAHGGASPLFRGDFTGDGKLNGDDIAGFTNRLMLGP